MERFQLVACLSLSIRTNTRESKCLVECFFSNAMYLTQCFLGGYLAELADGDEYDLLNTYMLQTDQSYWIGLTDEA